jgi:hypothetical protein
MLNVGRQMDVPLRTLVNEPTEEDYYWGRNSEDGRIPLNADGLPPSPSSVPKTQRITRQDYLNDQGKKLSRPKYDDQADRFITDENASRYPAGAFSDVVYPDGGGDANIIVDYQEGQSSYPKGQSKDGKFSETVQKTVNPALYYRGKDGEAIRVQPDSRVIVPPTDSQMYMADGRALTPQVLAANAKGKMVARTVGPRTGVGGITPNAVGNLGQFGRDITVDADTFTRPATGSIPMGRQGNPSVAAPLKPDGTPDRYINPDALPLGTSVFDVTPMGQPVRSIPQGFTGGGAVDKGLTTQQIVQYANADTQSNGDPSRNSKGEGVAGYVEVDESANVFNKNRIKAGDIAEEINRQADNAPQDALSLEDARAAFYNNDGSRSLSDGRQRTKTLEDAGIGGGGDNQNKGVTPLSKIAQSGDLLIGNPVSKNFEGRGMGGGKTQVNRQGAAQDLANMEVAGRSFYNSGDTEYPDANASSSMFGNAQSNQRYDNKQRARVVGQQLREFARRRSPVDDPIETDTPGAFTDKYGLFSGQKISETQNFVPGPSGSLVNEVRPDKDLPRQAGGPQTAAAIAALEKDFPEIYALIKGGEGYDISSPAGGNRQIPMDDPELGSKILFSPGKETNLGADTKVPPFPEGLELPTTNPQDRVKAFFPTSSTFRVAPSQSQGSDRFVESADGGIFSRTEQMFNPQTGKVEGVQQYDTPGVSYMEQYNEIGKAADFNKRMLRKALSDDYSRGAVYLDDDRRPMAPHYDYTGPDGIPLQQKYAAEDRANGLPVRPTAYDVSKRVHDIAQPQYGRPFDGNDADPTLSQFSPEVLKQAYATKELNNRLAEATETVYKYHTEFSPTPDQDNLTRTITVQNQDGTTSTIKKMMTTQELMDFQKLTRELPISRIVPDYSGKLESLKPSYRLVSPTGEELPNPLEKNFSPYTTPAPTPEPPQFQGGLSDKEDMSYGSPGVEPKSRQLRTGTTMMKLAPGVQQIPQSRDAVIYDPVEYAQAREQSAWEAEQAQQRLDFGESTPTYVPRTQEELAFEAKLAADAQAEVYALREKVSKQAQARRDQQLAARYENLAQ